MASALSAAYFRQATFKENLVLIAREKPKPVPSEGQFSGLGEGRPCYCSFGMPGL